jgi:prepilin-type N-terminal cleavage/methylation domain-containing protein
MIHSRRGFTLVELLVAMVLFAMVGLSLVQTMVVVQRTTRTQSEQTAMQGSLRAGLQLVITELEELSPNPDAALGGGEDFSAGNMGTTSFQYRAMRILSQTCEAVEVDKVTIRAQGPLFSGFRRPVANRDSMLVFEDRDADESGDDRWTPAEITGVADVTCTGGGAGFALTTSGLVPGNFISPGPVRVFETMQLGVVAQDGRNWLGLRSMSGGDATLTPLAGPLASSGQPVSFFYRNAMNQTAAAPVDVRSIVIVLAGESDRAANAAGNTTPGLLADTVTVRVQLRNTH